MADPETQYDLKLGLDTGPSAASSRVLKSELAAIGTAADTAQAKIATAGTKGAASIGSAASAASSARASYSGFTGELARNTSASIASSNAAKAGAASTERLANTSSVAAKAQGLLADGVAKAESGMLRFARSALSVVAVYASISTGQAAVASSLSDFRDFERTIAAVEVVAGASASEISTLTRATRDLGEGTIYSMTSIAQSEEALARSGLNVARITATLPAILDLATSANVDLGQATDVVVNVQHAFGISARESITIADNLALAANRTATDVSSLAEGLKYVGPISRALGKDLSETSAGLGVLSNAGMQASMAGTGLRRIFSELAAPTDVAKKTLKELHLTIDELNPETNSLASIVLKLAAAGIDAGQAFKIFGDRGAPAIINLVNQAPRLVSLTGELRNVENAASTMASRLTDTLYGSELALKSTAQSARISLGEVLSPAIREAEADFQSFLSENRGELLDFGRSLASAVSAGASSLLFLAQNLDVVKSATIAWVSVRAVEYVVGLLAQLRQASVASAAVAASTTLETAAAAANTAALEGEAQAAAADALAHFELAQAKRASAVASAEAAAAEVLSVTKRGQAGTYGFLAGDVAALSLARQKAAETARNAAVAEAELALAGGRVKGIIDANTLATEKAAKSSAFWSLGLTKTAVGLASFAAVLLYLNDQVVDFSENAQREMDAIVRSTNEFAQRLRDAKGETADLLDQAKIAAEIEKSLLAAGVKAGTKEGDFLAAQVMNDLQRRRVDLLYEQRDALKTAGEAVTGYSERLADLRDRERQELAAVQELSAARAASPGGRGVGGVVNDLNSKALDEAKRKLAETRAEIDSTTVALNRASIDQRTLARTTGELEQATSGFRDETRLLSDDLGGLGNATEEQEKKFQKIARSLGMQTEALRMLAEVYSLDAAARADAIDAVEVENRLRQEAADLTAEQTEALRPMIAAMILAQRTAEGAKTIDGLRIQAREVQLLNAAYAESVQSANATKLALELEARNREATAGAAQAQREEIERLNAEIAAGQELSQEIQFETDLSRKISDLQELEAAYYGGAEAIQAVTAAQARKVEYDRIIAQLTPEQVAMFDGLIKKYLDLGEAVDRSANLSALRLQRDELERTNAIRRSSFLTTGAYEEALRKLNIELELERQILASKVPLTEADIAAMREQITAISELNKAKQDQSTWDSAVSDFTGSLSSGFKSAINTGLVELANGGDDVAKKIGDSLKRTFIQAAADYLTSMLSALAKELVIRLANVAKEAAARQAANAAGGAGGGGGGGWMSALGSLFGGGGGSGAGISSGAMALGAWVAVAAAAVAVLKHQVDRANAVRYQTTVQYNTGSGNLLVGGKLQETGGKIADAFKALLDEISDATGALLEGAHRAAIAVRNDKEGFRALVDGVVVGTFKTMDEAIVAAMKRLFSAENLKTQLDPVVQQVIDNFDASKGPQAFAEAVRSVSEIVDGLSGLSDVELSIRDINSQAAQLEQRLRGLGVSMADATAVAERWKAQQFQNARDEITGHQATAAEQRAEQERKALYFNAQLALTIAEEELRKGDIESQLATLRARVDITNTKYELDKWQIESERALAQQGAEIAQAELDVRYAAGQASIALLEAQLEAINQSMAALKAIKPIDLAEIRIPNTGHAGGGLGNVDTGPTEFEQRVERFVRFLEDADLSRLSDYARALREINDTYDEQRATLDEIIAASDGSAESLALLAEQERALAEWRREETARLREDIIDAFGSPMEEIRDRADEIRQRVADWFASGQEIVDQFNAGEIDLSELMAALEEANILWSEFGDAARAELMNLALYFTDAIGDTEQSAAIREELAQLEWDLKRAEMAMMLSTFHELGLISDEVFERWNAFVANLPEDRPPAPDPTPPSTSGDDGAQATKDRFLEELARQIKEWNELGLGPAQRDARALRERYEELHDEAVRLGVQTGELTAAYRFAADHMVDEILRPFEDLELSDLEIELRDLREEFLDYAAAFDEIGASAAQMARLEEARIAALEDFWERATAGLRDLLDEINGEDPRRGPRERFEEAQAEFRDLAARAASGDLAALEQLEAAARDYRDATAGFLGEGVGAQAIGDEISEVLRSLIDNNPLLGDGASDAVATRIDRTNSILTAIADRLGAGIPVVASDAAARQNGEAIARALGVTPLSSPAGGLLSGPPPAPGVAANDNRLASALESIEALLSAKRSEEERERKARISRAAAAAANDAAQDQSELLSEIASLLARIAANTAKPPAGR